MLPAFAETTPPPPPRIVILVDFGNGLEGGSHGVEATADVRPSRWWRLTTNYSYLRIAVSRKPGSQDVSQERQYEGASPRHQVQMQSSFDLPRRWFADGELRHVSALTAGSIPAYTTMDARVAWQVSPTIELSLVGQDLNHARHVEWPSGTGPAVEIQRSGYVKLVWRR